MNEMHQNKPNDAEAEFSIPAASTDDTSESSQNQDDSGVSADACARECAYPDFDPSRHPRKHDSLSDRLWRRVNRSGGPDACWPWAGRLTARGGYGMFWMHGRIKLAHKVAWELTSGRVAQRGSEVMHSCDNRPCCNPGHLSEGTRALNALDMHRKGRAPRALGARNGKSRLTESQVREAIRLRATGMSRREVAARFGVDWTTISDIDRGRTWAHVSGRIGRQLQSRAQSVADAQRRWDSLKPLAKVQPGPIDATSSPEVAT